MDKYDQLFADFVQARQVQRDIVHALIEASFEGLHVFEGLSWADIREKLERAAGAKDDRPQFVDDGFLDMWTYLIEMLLQIPKEERETAKRQMLAHGE